MNKLIFTSIALSFCLMYSAHAKDLGVLMEDQMPQDLIQASEFSNFLNSAENTGDIQSQDAVVNHSQNRNTSAYRGWGWGSYGYYPSYYPYYYYPYYSYGSYYPYYYSGWYLDDDRTNTHSRAATNEHSNVRMDAAHTPVVCFASNAAGHWFANADTASNVASMQEKSNIECRSAGGSCSVNLGCALAYGDNNNNR